VSGRDFLPPPAVAAPPCARRVAEDGDLLPSETEAGGDEVAAAFSWGERALPPPLPSSRDKLA